MDSYLLPDLEFWSQATRPPSKEPLSGPSYSQDVGLCFQSRLLLVYMMNMKRRNSRAKTAVRSSTRLKDALRRLLRTESLERRDLMSVDGFNPYHNYDEPVDSNSDGHINAMDALVVINALNAAGGSKPLNLDGSTMPRGRFVDVNNDGHMNAMDALNVINRLGAEGEGSDFRARLTLSLTDMLGNSISNTALPVDYRFRLVTNIQDIRPNPEGFFSMGTNILNSSPSTIRLSVGETQRIVFANEVTSGNFTLSYNGQTTGNIAFAPLSSLGTRIKTALNPFFGANNFSVRNPSPTTPRIFDVVFRYDLLDTNIQPITGNFAGLSTSNPSIPSGTIVDDFFPADPMNLGAVRNSIEWLNFPNPTLNEFQMPDAGTLLNIGAFADGTSGDPEPDIVKPSFALFFRTIDDGTSTFRQTYASPTAVPIGQFDISNTNPPALTEDQVIFDQLPVVVVRNLTAVDDTATVIEDTTTNINVLANDTTIILGPAGAFSISQTTNPTNGSINIVTVNGLQQIAYRPSNNYFGSDQFTYTIRNNNNPVDTATGTVFITVTPVNDPPVASPDTITATEDIVRTILASELTANDNSGTGESDFPLTISVVQNLTSGGSVAINNDGNVVYSPAQDFNGQFRFQYKIKDSLGLESVDFATVVINVAPVNDAPLTTNDTVTGAVEDTPRTIAISSILANDRPGPTTAVDEQRPNQDVVLLPASISGTTTQGGTVQIVGGNLIYTPFKDFSGTDTFTYNIEDTGDPRLPAATPGIVTIVVAADNDPPEAGDDDYVIDEFSTDNELDVLANDNPGSGETSTDSISIQSFTQPANGSVRQAIVGNKPMLLYTPNADFVGVDTFEYTIVDGGGKTDTATVTLDVVPVVRPRARTDRYSMPEDTINFDMNVMLNDLANIGNFKTTLVSFTQPAHGTLVLNSGPTSELTDDYLVYTPNGDYNGPDSFTYTINDTSGLGADSTATVFITVTEVNDRPTAVDDQLTSTEGAVYNIPASALTVNDIKGPANESSQVLSIFSVSAVSSGGNVALDPNTGNVIYTPTPFFNGQFVFSYIVRDNGTTAGNPAPANSLNPAMVTITVSEVNDAPIAVNDTVNGVEDIPLNIPFSSFLNNDLKGPVAATDEVSQTLTITAGTFTTARGGTVVINGTSATYTPAPFFNGTDSFSYEITDNGTTAGSADPKKATAVMTLVISEVNNAPTANEDSVIAYKNFPVVYEASRFLANDSAGPNESSQTLTLIEVFALPGTRGTAVLNNDGTISYTPEPDFVGEDRFGYRIRDNGTTNGVPQSLTDDGVIVVDVKDFVPSSISGVVYGEETSNTTIDPNERFLGGVAVRLQGTALGEPVDITTYTLADGSYSFDNLAPGNYRVIFTPPTNMVDGADITGSHGDLDTVANQFTIDIAPPGNVQATDYNFALNGLQLKYALQLDSLASPFYSRDASLRTNGMFGLIRPGNNFGWTAAMAGYENVAFAEMVLNNDGSRLVLSIVDHNEEIHTTVLGRGQFVRVTDDSGNSLVRVLGAYNKFTWNKVSITATPPITAAKYLDSVEAIFAQEDWDGIPGN